MNLRNRFLASAVVVGAVAIGGLISAAPANAAVATNNAVSTSVEGGVWNYGVSTAVWSEYYNPFYKHRSTACDGNDNCTRSADTGAGGWAGSVHSKTGGGNTAFYYNY